MATATDTKPRTQLRTIIGELQAGLASTTS